MIKTTRQLKDKIRNLSGGDSKKAQSLIRNYIMEEFLLRLSLSSYKDNFILKGGMLVSSLAGINSRATMDIDATVKSVDLTIQEATKAIEEICAVAVEDNISFRIVKASDIMEESDYPGIRFMLEAKFDNLIQPVKIDISTGDIITPAAIDYSYKMMFDGQTINLMSYNIETLLAEKLETIISRGTDNTRMRDFYDIHIISGNNSFNNEIFREAFNATTIKRNTQTLAADMNSIIESVVQSDIMEKLWNSYVNSNWFVENLSWNDVCRSVQKLAEAIAPDSPR